MAELPVTTLLMDWRNGNREAGNELMARMQPELRRIAAAYMRKEHPGHTLQATALVHEAYLRLLGGDKGQPVKWDSAGHYFAAAAEAMAAGGGKPRDLPPQELLELDAQFSHSDVEKLMQKDFEAMNAMEIRQAEQAIRSLRLDLPQLAGRRYEPVARALRIDRRKTVQQARRNGGEILTLAKRRAKPRKLNLVVLCDISGSMTRYSRMMMHFVHSCAQARGSDWAAVHAFTFGTQLHNISPQLGIKDPDAALAAIGQHVQDWEGGTRISASLGAFNRDWARRVLSTPAVVLLISDGLERSGLAALDGEMSRLALQARELIWLNPLLRWEQFSPQAAGIKAMLPHVSSLVACHNLSSLEDLSDHFFIKISYCLFSF